MFISCYPPCPASRIALSQMVLAGSEQQPLFISFSYIQFLYRICSSCCYATVFVLFCTTKSKKTFWGPLSLVSSRKFCSLRIQIMPVGTLPHDHGLLKRMRSLGPIMVFTATSILMVVSILGIVVDFSIYRVPNANASVGTSQNLTLLSVRAESRHST